MNDNFSSIDKAILILKCLSDKPYEMTALEISDELSINRSTTHRVLNVLIKEMLVLQNPMTRKYSIGPAAYHIGSAYLIAQGSMEQIKHILSEVARETQQSVGYAVLDGGQIINIFEIESFQPIKIGYREGSFYPINCGAYGKSIMAFYEPLEELKEIVHTYELVKKTPNSITDPELLLQEYERIRQMGYAISDEEGMIGAIGVGAPVKNAQGKVVACVAAAAVKSTIDEKQFEYIKDKVIEGARKISLLIL